MGILSSLESISEFIPEVKKPTQRKLSFKEKLKWTLAILAAFFVLSLIPLYGLGGNSFQQFEFLSVILGASFGSILSLGIGPIVTASIVLQLLSGSGLLPLDLTTHEGKKQFQALQKIGTLFFILFEAGIYVLMGGLTPDPAMVGTAVYTQMQFILIAQLALGGLIVVFMDDVVSKWGFGSGVSLFILANVSQSLFIRAFSPLHPATNPSAYVGAIPELMRSLSIGDPKTALLEFFGIAATVVVFVMCVYGQAMKIEIPLSFGRVRGYSIRWPLNFLYTSNIPVILASAVLINIQIVGLLLFNSGISLLGTYSNNQPVSGFAYLASALPSPLTLGNYAAYLSYIIQPYEILHIFVYGIVLVVLSVIFGWFWIDSTGMSARDVAKQLERTGLQIPGFRADPRIIEGVLNRYIPVITILGSAFVGILAWFADITGALGTGTGILLTVGILYKFYEDLAQQQLFEMYPVLKRVVQ